MNQSHIKKWRRQASRDGAQFLLGGQQPEIIIRRRLKREEQIQKGFELYPTTGDFIECKRCLFKIPWDCVKYMQFRKCLICYEHKTFCVDKFEVVSGYKTVYNDVYKEWLCIHQHRNKMCEWYCRGDNCKQTISSKGSTGSVEKLIIN